MTALVSGHKAVSISGHEATICDVADDRLRVQTSHRLCPGRVVNVRVGRQRPTPMAVLASAIVALAAKGPVYAVQLGMMETAEAR
jgi:hypothetical protein